VLSAFDGDRHSPSKITPFMHERLQFALDVVSAEDLDWNETGFVRRSKPPVSVLICGVIASPARMQLRDTGGISCRTGDSSVTAV
jgi:hypothetical protein